MKTFSWAELIEEKVYKKDSTDLIVSISSIINVLNFVAVISLFAILKFYIAFSGDYNARWYIVYLLPAALITTFISWGTGSYVVFYAAELKKRKLKFLEILANQINLPLVCYVAYIAVLR